MRSVRPDDFELVSKVQSARVEEPGLAESSRMHPERLELEAGCLPGLIRDVCLALPRAVDRDGDRRLSVRRSPPSADESTIRESQRHR
jgi:hypothetical protein